MKETKKEEALELEEEEQAVVEAKLGGEVKRKKKPFGEKCPQNHRQIYFLPLRKNPPQVSSVSALN